MSLEAGKRVYIKQDSEELPMLRGLSGKVSSHTPTGVWVELDTPLEGKTLVKVNCHSLTVAPWPTVRKGHHRPAGRHDPWMIYRNS